MDNLQIYLESQHRAVNRDKPFFLGLDLGQASDPTALVVLERVNQGLNYGYHLRHLQRFPLGTRYPVIIAEVRKLQHQMPEHRPHYLVVDATGVGRAVVDLMAAEGVEHVPITITAGNEVTRDYPYYRVPKRDLVGVLQVLLQTKRLLFAEGLLLAPVLIAELQNFKAKISTSGKDTYEAWRENDHDDMVLALALAVWYAERGAWNTMTREELAAMFEWR